MTKKYKNFFCTITDKHVQLSREEFKYKNLFRHRTNFVCDEAAQKICKEKDCQYPSNN